MSETPTKRRGPRGPYAKSATTRAAILDAALEVFADGGFRAGSLRAVAERVGISEAGLLHHFGSKGALLEAVLDRRDEQALAGFDFEATDGAVRLRAILGLAEYNTTIPGVVELFCTLSAEATSADHPAHHYFVARYEMTRRMLTEAFADLADRGLMAPGITPAQAARMTVGLWDGVQLQWLLDPTVLDVPSELRALFDGLVVGGIDAA